MAVVFFILMLASATLEAQRNEKDKFFDLMTTIGEYFGGEFNKAEKALEIDLNGANSFLKELHTFATLEIVTKNENGEFECKKSEKPAFKMAIKTILDEDMRNLLKAIIVPKPIKTIFDEKSDKKVEDFLKALIVPKKSDQIPSRSDQIPSGSDQIQSGSVDSVKFSDEQLFNLLFTFAARLEALVHGKNIDGTLKEKQENPKEKIQTFLAVPKCFQETKLSIFDYWIEIIEMKTKNSQKPIFGVAIYKEKYDKYRWEGSKERAFNLSRANYLFLEQLNDQKFSIYESLNILRNANWMFSPRRSISRGKIPQIFAYLLNQINSTFYFNWKRNEYWDKNKKCEYAMFFQNISKSLMKMMSAKGIDPELHLDSDDNEIREEVQKDVEENCKKFENEEAKIIFLNNVHFELAINFEFIQRKDVHDRAKDLLSDWVGDYCTMYGLGLFQLTEESYLKKNASQMLNKIKHFTSEKTNRESNSIIEALIGKEFNLVTLFDQIKTLVEGTIPEEQANLVKAKKEINTKQLKNEIEFLKNNPKSIAEEKYQKAVAIICTILQYGEKVEMLKSKIETFEIKEQLNELSSKIQKNETENFGPELWKQTKEFCKIEQIEMEEIVSEEIILKDIQFEFNKIWKSSKGVWQGIEKYYLSIPLMQLLEQARTLAKTFGKMLENVKEHYAQKMDASNVGEDMIMPV